ncbi:hypothetical protein D3D01_20190 [Haloarcula sp. Atlit-7R]|nr:hypothetical protein D3D01_20190 [Haloarcula sp. Atlit-7R]
MTNEEILIFERGDVVYGDDPFKGEEVARPWLMCFLCASTQQVHTLNDIDLIGIQRRAPQEPR